MNTSDISYFSVCRKLLYPIFLPAGSYKEQHRLAMIKWSEEIRNADYTYFCKAAIEKYTF